jgi:hypothetical protein
MILILGQSSVKLLATILLVEGLHLKIQHHITLIACLPLISLVMVNQVRGLSILHLISTTVDTREVCLVKVIIRAKLISLVQ